MTQRWTLTLRDKRHKDVTKPQHGMANAGQDKNNSSRYKLYTAEILQPANGWLEDCLLLALNNFMHVALASSLQGQQLYAWHGTPSRRPQAAPPFPLIAASEATQPPPPALPPEAWPCECNTDKA